MIQFIHNLDFKIIHQIYFLQNPFLNKIMIFFTHIGDIGLIWILLTVFLLFNKKYRFVGIISLISLILCLFIVNIGMKPTFSRLRPFQVIDNLNLLIPAPKDFSFPSGHAAASFVMVYIFYKHIKKYFIIILIIASLISFSRIYLTVHFPSDVIVGIILGLFSGYLGNKIYFSIKK